MGRCENTGMPHNNFLALSIITTSITKFIMLMDVGRAGTLHVIAVVHHTHGRSINIIGVTSTSPAMEILVKAAGNKRRCYRLKTHTNDGHANLFGGIRS